MQMEGRKAFFKKAALLIQFFLCPFIGPVKQYRKAGRGSSSSLPIPMERNSLRGKFLHGCFKERFCQQSHTSTGRQSHFSSMARAGSLIQHGPGACRLKSKHTLYFIWFFCLCFVTKQQPALITSWLRCCISTHHGESRHEDWWV